MFRIGSFEIDLTALAALVSALTMAYATVKGQGMRLKAKQKEIPNAGKNSADESIP